MPPPEVEARQMHPEVSGQPRPLFVVLGYSVFSVLWILLSDTLLAALVDDPKLLIIIGTLKGWVFVALTSLLLYGLLRSGVARNPPMHRAPRAAVRVGFIAAVIGIVAAGATAMDVIIDRHLSTATGQLQAIVRLKAHQFDEWLANQHQIGNSILVLLALDSPPMVWPDPSTQAGRQVFVALIEDLRQRLDYRAAFIVDSTGQVVVGDAGPFAAQPTLQRALDLALREGSFQSTDIYPATDTELSIFYIDHVLPLRTAGQTTGYGLVLRRDDRDFRQALLDWPLPGASGQVALVGKVDNEVLLLGRLLDGSPSAEQARQVSQAHPDDIGAKIGRDGVLLKGRDQAGTSVLGVSLPLTGSEWKLIASIDERKVHEQVRNDLYWIALAIALSLLGVILAFLLRRRHEELQWHRRREADLVEQQRLQGEVARERRERGALSGHYATLIEKARDAVLLINGRGRIIEANEAAERQYGWPVAELLEMSISDLRAPGSMGTMSTHWQASESTDGVLFETEHRRRDGTTFPVEVSSRAISIDGELFRQSFIRDISARKAAAQALRDSERRYRELFEASPCAMWVFDRETLRFLAVNQAAIQNYGYSREEFLALTIEQVRPAEDIPRLRKDLQQAGAGVSKSDVWRHLRKDGSEMQVEITPQPIEFEGRPAIMELVNDITEQQRQTEALRVEAQRAKALLELPLQAEVLDEQRFIEHGLNVAEMLTGSAVAFIHFLSDDGEAIAWTAWSTRTRDAFSAVEPVTPGKLGNAGMWSEAARRRQQVVIEMQDPRQAPPTLPAGHAAIRRFIVVPVIERGRAVLVAGVGNRPSPYEDAEIETVQLIANDLWRIVQRQRTGAQLHKLSMAVEQSPESIVICDVSGTIEYVNDAFVEISGYARDELIGHTPRMLQSGKTPADTYASMWRNLSAGLTWRGEFINRRKDGSEYIEFARLTPIRDETGAIAHYVAVKEDITEKKRVAAELDAYRHQLEDLVAARTLELNESRQRAEAASRAKSVFLANVSHEVRTPLNAIIGLGHLLAKDIHDPAQQNRLRKMDGAARHLLSIINDILDLSKVEAGKLHLDSINFELAAVIGYVHSIIQPAADEKGLEVCVECGGVPAWLRGDPLRLRQALLNYASNAVKFTAAGRVTLRVTVARREGDALLLRFEVADTGIGIAANDAASLFRAFEQGDPHISRKYGGTGLGLAFTRKLAQLMGGSVGVDSTPGVGSCFWFTARLELGVPAAETWQIEVQDEGETSLRERHAGARVLLVEDNPVNRELATELLGLAGLVVATAENGLVAVDEIEQQAFDLVLMDLQMPEMDGFEATRVIRGRYQGDTLPILAMSANASDLDRAACLDAGMNGLIPKPVIPADLYRILDDWLSRKHDGASPAEPSTHITDTQGTDQSAERADADEADSELGALQRVAGFDVAHGLRLSRNKVDRYRRTLDLFLEHHLGDAARLASCLADDRLDDAIRAAHTLKGSAGVIGATALAEASDQVERMLRDGVTRSSGEASANDLLAQLAQRLSEVCSAIARLARGDDVYEGSVIDVDAVRVHLCGLLASHDTDALAVWETNRAALLPHLGTQGPAVDACLRRFDFAQALALLGVSAADR